MLKFIRSLFCGHDYSFVRNIYGDEIHHAGGRSLYKCSKCDKFKVEQALMQESGSGDDNSTEDDFFKDHDRIKKKWEEECPEFDDFEYNKIIDWLIIDSKGEIAWENTFISYKNGVKKINVDEERGCW